MSEDREALIEAEKEIQRLKVALTNAAAIEKSYLKFGPIFDEDPDGVVIRFNGHVDGSAVVALPLDP